MMFRTAASIVLVGIVAFVHGLSEVQTAYFGTSGLPEQNTGLTGWVTVTDLNPNVWLINSNNIPDHITGEFPSPVRGVNPNEIEEQDFSFRIAKNPVVNPEPTCLPMGPIAVAVNGIVMYNPWDVDGENAVEGDGAEVFDECDGHPDGKGRYHYHRQPSSCLFEIIEGEPSPLIGVAFDGFAIYGPVDENGQKLTSDDLDECHGRINSDGVYQYHTTSDFPYILGCYRGTPKNVNTGSDNCHKASEAVDDQGNLVPVTAADPDPTTTPPTRTTRRPCRNPNSRRCLNSNNGRKRRFAGPANAQIPRNLFARKLPDNYNAFLQNAIFSRRSAGPQ